MFSRVDDTALRPAPQDDTWLADLPPGALTETARRLQAQAEQNPAAGQALLDLYRLSQEAA
jgi:hypothetical protein